MNQFLLPQIDAGTRNHLLTPKAPLTIGKRLAPAGAVVHIDIIAVADIPGDDLMRQPVFLAR